MKYTCIDAFSGAGGLSLGLKFAGFDTLLSFDINKTCIDTISGNSKYFNHHALCEDINNMLNGKLLEITNLKKGELFLLAGGPPCQGFSIQRIGEDDDPRNELVLKYGQLISEVYPKYFLMENVAGILGKRGKSVINDLQIFMEELGYTLYVQLLDAQEYGVPQRRKRVFIVGVRKDLNCSYHFPNASLLPKKTVYETISSLPEPPLDGTDHPNYSLHRRDKLSDLNKRRLQALQPGQGRDNLPDELLANCHKVSSSVIGHRKVYGRMPWNDVAPTITARFDSFTRGQFGHPEQLRSISLREGALIQTFPIDFEFKGTKVEIASQIGNAVPPVLGKIIGQSIIQAYEGCSNELSASY